MAIAPSIGLVAILLPVGVSERVRCEAAEGEDAGAY